MYLSVLGALILLLGVSSASDCGTHVEEKACTTAPLCRWSTRLGQCRRLLEKVKAYRSRKRGCCATADKVRLTVLSKRKASRKKCMKSCDKTLECRSFDHNHNDNSCSLYSGSAAKVTQSRSGGKRCKKAQCFYWVTTTEPRVTEVSTCLRTISPVMFPDGSPWCHGNRTYWWTGHDNSPEQPRCEISSGIWKTSSAAALSVKPFGRFPAGDPAGEYLTNYRDRHGCAAVDLNEDGVLDVVCSVGAVSGTGVGYIETYLTQGDGSLVEVLHDVGFWTQGTRFTRGRHLTTLRAADGSQLLFLSMQGCVNGGPCRPGEMHHMFKVKRMSPMHESSCKDVLLHPLARREQPESCPQFVEEVFGPWNEAYASGILVAAVDIDGDGFDDLVVGNERPYPFVHWSNDNFLCTVYHQHANGTWSKERLGVDFKTKWRAMQVADVTNDGVVDIVVAEAERVMAKMHYLVVIEGRKEKSGSTTFDLTKDILRVELGVDGQTHVNGVTVFDHNADGIMDIYVTRAWQPTCRRAAHPQPCGRDGWQPLIDNASDVIFTGAMSNKKGRIKWSMSEMPPGMGHGCGSNAAPFGAGAIAVSRGTIADHGSMFLVEW